MKKVLKSILVSIMIICCVLMIISCDNSTSTVQNSTNSLSSSQEKSSSSSQTKTYLKAKSPTADFKSQSVSKKLAKTETKVIEQTVTDRNPWLFCAGLVGAIIYAVGNTYVVKDVYTVKYYTVHSVENETIWAMTPVYYSGGKTTISASKEQITEEGIENTITQSVSANVGINLGSLVTIEVGGSTAASISTVYKESIGKVEAATFDLSGYEPNKYYRLAVKMDYIVYEVVVTNSKNEVIEKTQVAEPVEGSIYARLESSASKTDFNK